MLSPRFAEYLLKERERIHGVKPSENKADHSLEPKFGWGHESFKEDLVTQIEALKFDHSWRPDEVRNAIIKIIENSKR